MKTIFIIDRNGDKYYQTTMHGAHRRIITEDLTASGAMTAAFEIARKQKQQPQRSV